MKLFVVRHTAVNIEPGICYGQSDVDVAESFISESVLVREKLHYEGITIYCSPLKRCLKLAEKTFPNRSVIIDKRLMELNFGDWELKSWDAIYSSIEGRTWMDNYQTNPTLGGESYLQMFERVSAFLEELKVKEISECVIFTHAGVVRILKSLIDDVLIGTLFETFKPAYGSITTFDLKY